MENKKDDSYITAITDFTTTDSSIFTTTISTLSSDCSVNYIVDSNSFIYVDNNSIWNYSDPYSEIKQQQEKEEDLRNENSCLQEAWNEYQLILKLLEENECDKFIEQKYGIKK